MEDKASDLVSELLTEGIARLDYGELEYDIEKNQPENVSWIVVDAEFAKYCTDEYTVIEYSNAKSMQAELLKFIKAVMTPELLEHIRSGTIRNLTLRIGPRALSGVDLNEQNGIELTDSNLGKTSEKSNDFGNIKETD